MDSNIVKNIVRFVFVLLLQVLVLKQVGLSWNGVNYLNIFIYPLLILLLPIKINRSLLLIIAFFIGLFVDIFYDSPGLHASSAVLMAFFHKYVLKFLEPVEGYNIDDTPNQKSFGFYWFLIYSSVLVFINVFFYFIMEAFSIAFFPEIIIKTIFGLIFSELIIILYVVILNPK